MSTSRYFLFVIGCGFSCALAVRAQGNTSQDSMLTLVGAWNTGHCEAVATDSEYVYIAKGSTLEILDLSNSVEPAVVGRLLSDAEIFQIAVSGNCAFLVREYRGATSPYSLSIVDIANPRSPRETASYELREYSRDHRICVRGQYVLVPFSRLFNDWHSWLGILDVSDPANPREIGKSAEFSGSARSVHVSGDFAYVGLGWRTCRIFAIDDPTHPRGVGSMVGVSDVLDVEGTRLYAASDDSLIIFDITTPSQPNRLGTCKLGHYILHAIAFGEIAYATHDSVLSVIDMSDPVLPYKIAELPLADHPRGLSVATKQLYVAGLWNGLHIFSLREPRLPVQETTYRTGRRTYDFCMADRLAFITHQERGLSIVDMHTPSSPQTLTYYPLDLIETRIHVEGEFAYVVGSYPDCSTGYLVILDIGDPLNPQEVGRVDLGGWASDVYVADHNAYVVLYSGELKILNVDDPTKPVELGFCRAMNSGSSILVQEGHAYVVGALSSWVGSIARLCIIDIHDPSEPMVCGIFDGGGGLSGKISVSGYQAYVTSGWSTDISYGSGLDIIEIGNPYRPERLCDGYSFEYSTSVAGLHVVAGHAYCAISGRGRGDGLEVLDIKDLSNIHRVAQFATSPARGVTVSNGFVILLAEDGLYLLQSKLPTSISQESETPTASTLHQNYPNPFNPGTVITYTIGGVRTQASDVSNIRLTVYDLLGREVAVLVDERKAPGSYEVQFDAKGVATGVYLYRLTAGSFVQSRKMTLIR